MQEIEIHLVDEISSICKSLLGSQVFEVGGAPIRKRLRGSIVPVLKSDEKGFVVGSDHERVHFCVWGRAGPLSAEVEENRTTFLVKELVVDPVSLRVGQLVIWGGVKVVDAVCKGVLSKV